MTGFVAPAASADAIDATLERAWRARENWPRLASAATARIASQLPEEPGSSLADLALEEARRGRLT